MCELSTMCMLLPHACAEDHKKRMLLPGKCQLGKLQILGRYDQYKPDKDKSDETKKEYTAGINYFIKGQAIKLMLNYVFCQNDTSKDSHRIILGTQLLL